MPEIDEIITVLKADDNEALEAIRKLDSTAKEARKSLVDTKDILVDIKDMVTEPVDMEVGISTDDMDVDAQQEIPVKVTVVREDEDEPTSPRVGVEIPDLNIEEVISTELAETLAIATEEEKEDADSKNIDKGGIPYKEGPEELINEERVQLLAEERFDLEELEKIGAGVSRITLDLDEDKVLKIIRPDQTFFPEDKDTLRDDFVQNLTEGIHEGLPEKLEEGLDYVVTKKADIDKDKSRAVMEKTSDAVFEASLKLYIETDSPAEVEKLKEEAFLEEAAKVDKEYGSKLVDMAKKHDTTVHYSELIRPDNMGFIEGVPVPVDPGGLAWKETEEFVEKNYPGGMEAFDEEVLDKAIERKEKLRMSGELADMKKVFGAGEDYNADDADLLNADDYITQEDEDEIKEVDEVVFGEEAEDIDSPDDVAAQLEAALGSQDTPDDTNDADEIRAQLTDIISQLSASDFVLDDGNTAEVTEDDIINFVRKTIKDMSERA